MSDSDKLSVGIEVKQPAEVRADGDIYLDWEDDLADDETISTCVITAYDSNGADVTSDLTSGNTSIGYTSRTSVALKGGTAGETYWLEHVIQTSGGSTKIKGHLLRVVEKDRA